MVLTDTLTEPAIAAITKSAKTGNIGDGKILMLPVEDAIRIRTAGRDDKTV